MVNDSQQHTEKTVQHLENVADLGSLDAKL